MMPAQDDDIDFVPVVSVSLSVFAVFAIGAAFGAALAIAAQLVLA